MHLHIFHAMPGCLPDGEVVCEDTAEGALFAWRADFRPALDEVADDGEFLELDTTQNLVTAADVESSGQRIEIAPYAYVIEHAEGDRADCEIAQDQEADRG